MQRKIDATANTTTELLVERLRNRVRKGATPRSTVNAKTVTA